MTAIPKPTPGDASSRWRVLRIQSRICVGGPALHTAMLSAHLNRTRFDTLLVGGRLDSGEESLTDWAESQGAHVRILKAMGRSVHWWDDFRALIHLIRLIRQFRPHIVHTHTAKAGALGRLAARFCGVPIRVHTFHGHVFHGYFHPAVSRLVIWVERFLAKISSAIVTISQRQYQDLVQTYRIVNPEKCHIIPLGFDFGALESASSGEFKRDLGLPADITLVGIIARLAPVKNHQLFLEGIAAWRQLQQGWTPAHIRFLIIGDGHLRADLEQTCHDLDLDDWVAFTSWRRDMPAVYQDLNLNVLVSRNEGTPVTLIEGICAGVPFLATDVGGIRDFAPPPAGRIIPADSSAHGVGQALVELLDIDHPPPRLPVEVRRDIVEKFGIQRLLVDIERLYDQLLERIV